jgi:hypothetical protein
LSGLVSSADVNIVFANLLQASQVPSPAANPTLTSTVEEKGIPTDFALQQNYPNPFNPSTTIQYGLPHASFVTLTVYNSVGQQVAQLVNEQQQAGYHDIVFRGDGLASGVYFCRLQAGDFVQTKKLMLLR